MNERLTRTNIHQMNKSELKEYLYTYNAKRKLSVDLRKKSVPVMQGIVRKIHGYS